MLGVMHSAASHWRLPVAPELHAAGHLAYRPEVDGLRAVAVVPVILFHAGFSWFSGGFVGVDVFFVISGFLITSIILTEKAAGEFTIAAFYERRARRILPALLFVMLACLVPAWLWLMPRQLQEFNQSMVAVVLFGSNLLFWRTSGYFDLATEERPLLHTWSLGVEEQFYVLFPLVILLLWPLGRTRLKWLLAVVAVASLGLAELVGRGSPMANFYLPITRAWELLVGSLIAFGAVRQPLHRRVGGSTAQALSALGLAAIVVAVCFFDKSTQVPGLWALLPTVGTALVLAFATEGTLAARLLSRRWMVGIGLISYSAYLWHQPLLAFARIRLLDRPAPAVYGLLAAASLVLAYFTWRYVEAPFHDRQRIGRRPLLVVSITGSVLFVVIGLAGHITKGFPDRLDGSTLGLIQTAVNSPKRDACHTRGTSFLDPNQACIFFNQNVTWATLGDSHTVEPAYALAEMLERRSQGVVQLSFSGCPPALLDEAPVPGCTAWLNRAVERIASDARIGNVLVGFRYSEHFFGDQLDAYPKLPDKGLQFGALGAAESRELMWRNFEAILARLQKSGKRVFVLLPVPELGRDIHKNISLQSRGGAGYALGTPVAYLHARNRYIDDKFATLTWSDTLIKVDPSASLCDDQQCYAVIGAAAMYFDDDHLSLAGARKALAVLEPYLQSGPPPSMRAVSLR